MIVVRRVGRRNELAADAGLTTGAATAAIDRLVEKGYVRRVPDATDRRRVLIEKTAKLEEVSKRFYGPLAERSLPLIDKFSNAELEAIVRFLKMGTDLVERRVTELIEDREAKR